MTPYATTAEPAELVVDATHQDLVAQALIARGVWNSAAADENARGRVDTSLADSLRLVLFGNFLPHLAGHAVLVRRAFINELRVLESISGRRFTDLDLLLFELRRQFAHDAGMVPLMGKNRDAAMVYPQADDGNPPKPFDGLLINQPSLASKVAVAPIPILADPGVIPDLSVGTGITVGMVDTPLDAQPRDWVFSPWAGHGKFVAGLIRRQAPGAVVLGRGGLNPETGQATSWEVARQIASFIGERIQVLNLSLGVYTEDGEPPLVLRRAIDKLPPEVLVVAAAGTRPSPPAPVTTWPAAMTDVAAVGATTEYKSQFSPREPWVDYTAKGVDVLSDYVTGDVLMADDSKVSFTGLAVWSGTSCSTATVSGAVAAAMKNPGASPRETLEELARQPGSPVAHYVHVPSD